MRSAPPMDLSALSTEELMRMRGEPQEQPATRTERAIGHPVGRTILGAASLVTAPFQLGANVGDKIAASIGLEPVVGKWTNEKLAQLEAMKRRGMAARSGNPVGEDWDIAGTAGSLIPAVGVYKGIARALPNVVSEQAPSLVGRVAGRAASGAGTAVSTTPDVSGGGDYFEDLAAKGAIGSLINVGVPAVVSSAKGLRKVGGQSYRAIRDTLRNFSDDGTTKLTEEHLRGVATAGGEPALKKTVGSLLDENAIVSPLTSADAIAAGNIGKSERFGGPLVRLQAELGSLPETTTRLQSLKAAQEEARKTALDKISGTPAERALAKSNVDKASEAYEAIKTRIVESDSVLEKLSNSPAFRAAEKYAEENIANSNAARVASGLKPIPFKQTMETGGKILRPDGSAYNHPKKITQYSADGLQQIKQALDQMTSNPTLASSLGVAGTEKAHIEPVKKTVVRWMDKNLKDWEFTRNQYRDAKTVQNRQKAGDVLKDILTGAKDEEKVGAWLQAQRNLPETLKTKLKQGKAYSVEFLPEQKKILDDITKELQRDAKVAQITKEVNLPGATQVVSGKAAQLPNPLYRPTMIANWFLKRGAEEGNETVNRKAAEILAEPKRLASILSKTPPKFHGQIKDALSDFGKYSKDPLVKAATIQSILRASQDNGVK